MKKERKIKGHYTLVNTYDATEEYDRESWIDYCESCEREDEKDNDEAWHEWATMNEWEDLEALMNNLRYSNLYGRAVIVEGTLGLWWGNPEVEQAFYTDPVKAIQDCIRGAWDVIIKKCGHRIEVQNLHHDGRNYFTITFLTPLGEGRYCDHGKVSTKNRENFIKLPEYLF